MSETGFSFSHVESPSRGASLPQGRHLIRGWVWPKPGGHFVDVRARVNERLFAGVHGLPRADLATHFKTGRPVALAEFYVAVELRPGEVEVVLEVLELEGRWTVFQTVRYRITPANPPVDFAVPSGPLRWHEFGRALQILLREKRRQPELSIAKLAHEVVSSIPYPRDLRHPPAPFHGHLDEPAAVARCGFGRSAVLGYLFHETQPIKRVLATFDLQVWQSVDHLQPSPNPAGYFTEFPQARNCALYALIDLPAQLPAPACLRLYAELADGSLHLCSVQRSRMLGSEDEKAPYPAQTQVTFGATLKALREAMSARDIAVIEDEAMRAEIVRLDEDFHLRAPVSTPAAAALRPSPASALAPLPRRVLVVTHSLDREGAPLFLVDYVRHLVENGAILTVLSPTVGPLRERFEAIGARVEIVDVAAIFAASSATVAKQLIGELRFDFAPYDLVVCNTFTTFWALHAAKTAKRRVLLYIHESTTPASFYHSRLHPSVIALVDEAFALADQVSFTTRSTRDYHTDYGRPANHRLTPGWIDVARIDAWRAENPREKMRARFALKPGELLVTNVGTVSGRKGQHIFARAVDLLWQRHPDLAARTQFVMLGGRHSPFDDMLGELLGQLDHANLTVHPETADYFPYYAAADLFVCSSFEESSPRVILETMAFATPILSSDVQGVPELVRPELEATLIPPGDTVALCEGMARLLRSPEIGRSLSTRARARVITEFEAGILLPRHAALAAEVAAG
ncbi:MAG TPA: glycosyltransferase family 4 protein [Lacunisphaera sp.]|jgi:glycosyltransferase involved in cell wall biosynthesis